MRILATLLLLGAIVTANAAPRTRNVVLIVSDGLRWQEIFTGADELLAAREPEGVAKIHEAAEKGRRDLAEVFTKIGDVALPADHAIARRVSRSIGHIEYHFEKLADSLRAIAA